MSGLFEHLAATDDSEIITHRRATAVANKRVKDRFGAFLANAQGTDLNARLALVEDDISALVQEVVQEHGGDAQKIEAAIKRSMMPAQPMPGAGGIAGGGVGGAPGAPGGMPTPGAGVSTCPQCGGQMVNGQCPTCQGGAYRGAAGAPGGAYGLTHSIPQAPSSGPVQAATTAAGGFCDECKAWKSGPKAGCTCDGDNAADDDSADEHEPGEKESSVHVARRPKLCPYHSEVVDISLGAGDAQAGHNAMAAHAWGDKHCKGAYEGACNFRPAMVSQKYWDDKKAEYDERREQRELERAQQPEIPQEPELSIETEPIMDAEPLPVEPGKEGVSDIDGELANAPSAVGGGELAMAASTHKEAEALKTVDLPTGDDTALGGPSPKIDKSPSGDQAGWSLDPIDTQMDGSPNPVATQDPTDKADYNKDDFLDQTKGDTGVSTQDALPTGKGLDGGGFNTKRNIEQYPTKTFGDNGTTPVTNQALSSTHTADGQQFTTPGGGTTQIPDYTQTAVQNQTPDQLRQQPDWYNLPAWQQQQMLEAAQQQQQMRGPVQGAIDPDKNPIRELMDEYDGWLMPNQVESALRTHGQT